MNKGVLFILAIVLFAGCSKSSGRTEYTGTAWGPGAFDSNGERIYFTATSERGAPITYSGFDMGGGMMMFMGNLACASCHGPDARGGIHRMHMHIMNSPDIRWKVLSGEEHSEGEAHEGDAGHEHAHSHEGYSLDAFRMAVTEGKHPDGDLLSDEMPRWQIGNDDLKDLADFLKSLP